MFHVIGYASLHRWVAVISMENGKVLDVEPLSKVCKVCKNHEEDADTTEHELWKAEHQPKWKANYTGSSPAMEPEGARRIFNRAVNSYFMEMVIARVLVLLKIFIRRIVVLLLRKKNVWVMSRSDLAQHYES